MKKRTMILAVTCLVMAIGKTAVAGATWTVNSGGGADYLTIQAAIDAGTTIAGDTINVAAGTYSENVDVNKAVTVVGLGGRDSTIVAGTATVGHGATLQGFRVGTAANGAFVNGDGATIDACWIETTGAATTHAIQIYPEYGTAAKNVTIKNSTIKTTTAGKAAIYVETRGMLDGFLLDNNDIIGDYGVTQSFGALNTTITHNQFTGIAGSTKRAIQIKTSMDNVLIQDNDITGFDIGIRLDNNLAALGGGPVVITGNNIWDNATENMQVKRAPQLQISGNTFSQSTAAPNIHIYSGQADLDVDFIRNNNILGATGIQNDTTTMADATFNWWGDATGPAHSTNPGGIGASVTDYVDYGNFLTAPIPEPTSIVLLTLGALGLLGYAGRRRKKRRS